MGVVSVCEREYASGESAGGVPSVGGLPPYSLSTEEVNEKIT
jgi:hypothetical protein